MTMRFDVTLKELVFLFLALDRASVNACSSDATTFLTLRNKCCELLFNVCARCNATLATEWLENQHKLIDELKEAKVPPDTDPIPVPIPDGPLIHLKR